MISIVLPAFNEERGIETLLKRIDLTLKEYRHEYKIFFVDDGSMDKTLSVVKGLQQILPIEILSHEKNRGLGEALKTGIFHAVSAAKDEDIIVTMDADNTHVPGLIMRLHRNIWEGCDVVIASRYVRNARLIGVPLLRRVLSRGAGILFRVFFPIPGVRDYTCGYRAYRASLLKEAFAQYGDELVSQSGFACSVDILLKLRLFHPIMSEVPLILRYDRKKEASKMNIGRTIRDTLQLFVRRRFG